MAESLSAAQIRAARAMLGWSLIDVSQAARVTVSVAHRFETSRSSTVGIGTRGVMRATFEAAGVVFLFDEGHGAGLRFGGLPDRGDAIVRE